jgi:hypothetical protein
MNIAAGILALAALALAPVLVLAALRGLVRRLYPPDRPDQPGS